MVLANGCWIEGELWYWDAQRRALCSLNFSNGQISIKFMDFTYPGYRVFAYGENIYITCQKEGRFLIYHRDSGTIKEVCIPEASVENVVYFSVQWEQYLYIVPAELMHQEVFCIDMETGDFVGLRDMLFQLEQGNNLIASDAQFLFPCVCEGVLWSAISYTKYYISYHLMTGELCIYQSEVCNSLWSVKCEKGILYMTQTDSFDLIVKKQEEAECIISVKEGDIAIKEPYSCIESLAVYQVALARKGRDIVVLNPESLVCEAIFLCEEMEEEPVGSRTIYCAEDETYIYVFPWLAMNLYAIRKGTWEVEKREFELDSISYSKCYGKMCFENKEENGVVWENAEMTLQNLCIYLANIEET